MPESTAGRQAGHGRTPSYFHGLGPQCPGRGDSLAFARSPHRVGAGIGGMASRLPYKHILESDGRPGALPQEGIGNPVVATSPAAKGQTSLEAARDADDTGPAVAHDERRPLREAGATLSQPRIQVPRKPIRAGCLLLPAGQTQRLAATRAALADCPAPPDEAASAQGEATEQGLQHNPCAPKDRAAVTAATAGRHLPTATALRASRRGGVEDAAA